MGRHWEVLDLTSAQALGEEAEAAQVAYHGVTEQLSDTVLHAGKGEQSWAGTRWYRFCI
jgi:hypothetical protein